MGDASGETSLGVDETERAAEPAMQTGDGMSAASDRRLTRAILGMDAWLETMRGAGGYGGPVAHWWQDCLQYTGAGLDWRYEGIIGGYLKLFERTGEAAWLDKARRAGDDLVEGQLPNGNYRASSFEANPQPGGTPHEAACDLGLIRLAQAMRARQMGGWEGYAQAAEGNLRKVILGKLWDSEGKYLRNLPQDGVFVPNKAATTVEALAAWIELTGEAGWTERYILPTLERICECQVQAEGKRLDGAIDQARGEAKREGWFFPFYNARCIPALVRGYEMSGEERYLRCAKGAMRFILRRRYEDGSFPQAVRGNGRVYKYPQWRAGMGDILRAMERMEAYMGGIHKEATLEWMLQGGLPSGGVRTASGFGRKGLLRRWTSLPDWRDLLGVCGWVDKAFHYLCGLAEAATPGGGKLQPFEQACTFEGRRGVYLEDEEKVEVRDGRGVAYRWRKGAERAEGMV